MQGCGRPLTHASSTARSRPWRTRAPGGSGCSLSSDSVGTSYLRLKLCFSPHLLICTHPRSCQPVELPPVLQSLHANPRRRKLQLGDPSSSGTCFGRTSSPFGGQSTPSWPPPEYPSGAVDSTIFLSVSLLLPFFSLAFTFFLRGKLLGIVSVSRCIGRLWEKGKQSTYP